MEKAGKSAKTLFKLKNPKTQIPGICWFSEQIPGIYLLFRKWSFTTTNE